MGADITYLPTAGKLVYLSLVTNACSRKIVGYYVHMSLQTEEVGEPLLAEMDSFVAQLLPHLLPLLDKPYFLFGHSNGALLAFAVANRLLRAGARPPAGIILSGKRSPSRNLVRERVSQLPDDALLARFQNLNGRPQELLREPDIMRLFFPAIRADFSLGETYELEDMDPILASIAALILAGDEDPAGIAEVFSWTDLFPAAATTTLRGDHFFINADPEFPGVLRAFCSSVHHASVQEGTAAVYSNANGLHAPVFWSAP